MVGELQTHIPDHNRPAPAQEHEATNARELKHKKQWANSTNIDIQSP